MFSRKRYAEADSFSSSDREDLIRVDVGCGYRGDLHYPNLDFELFVEPFLNNSNDEWISLLRSNGAPIMASAQDLPFRKGVLDEVQCRAVMEHLPKPQEALRDFRYVLKKGGKMLIIIPIITNHFKHYLALLFIAFPFGIIEVVGLMKRMSGHYMDAGLAHISDVKPKDVKPYFKNVKVYAHYYRHKIFYGWWGRFIKRFITQGREPMKDIQGYYTVVGER